MSHIRMFQLQMDNTTAVAYVNALGGKKELCNKLARNIWEWCIQRNIWISACYLPGVLNVEADRQSRLDHDNTEWQLNPNLFHEIQILWDKPDIHLFASRLNYQAQPYISWKRDPKALAVDAFSILSEKCAHHPRSSLILNFPCSFYLLEMLVLILALVCVVSVLELLIPVPCGIRHLLYLILLPARALTS